MGFQVVDEAYQELRAAVDWEIAYVDNAYFKENPQEINPSEIELSNLIVEMDIQKQKLA